MPSLFMLAFDIHRRAFTCMTFLQIGLMILYCSFIRSRSRALMMLTVIGRLRYYSPKPLNHDNIRVGPLPPPSLLLPQRLLLLVDAESYFQHSAHAFMVRGWQGRATHTAVSSLSSLSSLCVQS